MSIKTLIIFSGLYLVLVQGADAKVTGVCSNCHTMHNSQNGASVVSAGPGAGWNGGSVSGGSSTVVQGTLLVTDCVGCHTSTGTAAIVPLGGSNIPIVNNLQEPDYPSETLAGGNFYWVAQSGGDVYGHNVRGISAKDTKLAAAPGSVGCANSCHVSLTLTDEQTDGHRKNGCQGCHNSVRHHGDDPAGVPVGEAGGWFRFLSAPSSHDWLGGAGVTGIENSDWEYHADSTEHNTYYGGDGTDTESPQSIGKFCAGCHYAFHSPGAPTTFFHIDNGGGANPWLRHPADAVIPDLAGSEYLNYTTYDPQVPVGRPDLGSFIAGDVRPGIDKVMCLSCHRAHGSRYPDLLRWDYNTMVTGATGAVAGTGCFKCHSTKDGVE